MKKLLLLAAIGVVGLVSAKSLDVKFTEAVLENQNQELIIQNESNLEAKKLLLVRYTFNTTCGTSYTFYFDERLSDYDTYYIMGALNEGDCGESPDYISIEG